MQESKAIIYDVKEDFDYKKIKIKPIIKYKKRKKGIYSEQPTLITIESSESLDRFVDTLCKQQPDT